jgi:hypothetical protein
MVSEERRGEWVDLINMVHEKDELKTKRQQFGFANTIHNFERLKSFYERRLARFRELPRNVEHIRTSRHDIGQPKSPRLYCRGEEGPCTLESAHKNSNILKLLNRFWRGALKSMGGVLSDNQLPDFINANEYMILYARLARASKHALYPFFERWPPFKREDITNAIRDDFAIDTKHADEEGKCGKYFRRDFESKILQLADLFCENIDGVDYFEYCKALYMLVYPRSVRKEILNLTTEREKIEARKSRKLMVLSSDEEHGIVDLGSSDVDVSRSKTNKFETKVNNWLDKYNQRAQPQARRIHLTMKRKRLQKLPKPFIYDETWAKTIDHRGWRRGFVKKAGGAMVGHVPRTPWSEVANHTNLGFLRTSKHLSNMPLKASTRQCTSNPHHNHGRKRPTGLGVHAVVFSNIKSLKAYVSGLHTRTKRAAKVYQKTPASIEDDRSYIVDVEEILKSSGSTFRAKTPVQIYIPVDQIGNDLHAESSLQI